MDRELVERARAGDQDAFAELVHQTSDTLFGIARRILRDPELAEDVLQNALVTIWRKLPHLREADRFEGWAFRILVNTCYAEAPSSRRWMAVARAALERADHTDDVQAFLDRDEPERAFRTLPLDQRAVFVLHHHVAAPCGGRRDARHPGRHRPIATSFTRALRVAFDEARFQPLQGELRHERRPRVPARHDRLARAGSDAHHPSRRCRPPGRPNDSTGSGSAEPVEAL
jgi:RNA polymerase sigma-70 factor (ECF subfamily)